jgi:Zn-finger nucleic acid-binding protein
MDCPVCKNVKLVMSDRQGIEIDYCPTCRGVWLDRGELDKIIDRSAAPAQAASPPPPQAPYRNDRPSTTHAQGYDTRHQQPHYKKKREGFLGELFDFD